MANLLSEAEELQNQCEAQGQQCSDLDELGRASGTVISQRGCCCDVASFLSAVDTQIGRVRRSVTSRANEIRTMDEKWNQFETGRIQLMKWLHQAKTNTLEALLVKENSLAGIQHLLPAIESILEEMKTQEAVKESLQAAGRLLIQLSPSSLNSVQNTMAVADTEWEVLQHMLLERQHQCQEIIALWNECRQGRIPVDDVIRDALETCSRQGGANHLPQAAAMNEQCRTALDKVRRTRLVLDNLLTKCNQLHNKLDNVDGFDTQPLRQQMVALQQVGSYLFSLFLTLIYYSAMDGYYFWFMS